MRRDQFEEEVQKPHSQKQNQSSAKNKGNRPRWLLIICVALLIAYSGFWYLMTSFVQNSVENYVQKAAIHGVDVRCENLGKTGYPLRVALSCSNFSVNFTAKELAETNNKLSLDSLLSNSSKDLNGEHALPANTNDDKAENLPINARNGDLAFGGLKLKAGAPVYAPHLVRIDMLAPAWLKMPFSEVMAGNWKKLQIQGNFASEDSRNVNLIAQDLVFSKSAAIVDKRGQQGDSAHKDAINVKFLRFDSKELADNQGSLTLVFDDLAVPYSLFGHKFVLPKTDGHFDMHLNDVDSFYQALQHYLQNHDKTTFRGQSVVFNKMSLAFERGGGFTLSGPISIADDGAINGEVTVAINDATALMRTMRSFFPAQANNLRSLFFVLNSMPKNDKGEPQLKMQISNSHLKMGFLKLGQLPRL